jgi:hypothetical protein
MATTATRDDQDRLRAFFDTLLGRRDAFAKVTVSVQRGRIAMVHVDRSYTLDQLPTVTPIRDDAS